MKIFRSVGLISLIVAVSSCASGTKSYSPSSSDVTAFVGVDVVQMTDDQVLTDQTVLIRAGIVEAIGPRTEVAVPASAKSIDGNGSWLMPGIIDTHVHLANIRESLDLFLANGVTTVRDLDGQNNYLEWADDIAKGKRLGPSLLDTGPILNDSVMDGKVEYQFDTAEKTRAEVQREWKVGYRSVKLYTDLNADAYKGAIEEAQKLGMYVTGHVPDSVGVEGVVAAGQKEIAHVEELRSAFIKDYDPKEMFSLWPMDRTRIKPVADLLAKNKVAVITSLSTLQHLYDQTSDIQTVLNRPEIAYQPGFATELMQTPDYYYSNRLPAKYLAEVVLPFYQSTIRELEDTKVPLLMGTDSGGIPALVWGWQAHRELQLLVDSGLTPYEALKSATITPSQVIPGLEDRGIVRVGARADLLLLKGNPLTKIGNTQSIVGVMTNGQWIDDQERTKMLDTAKAKTSKVKQ
jgi:imidazolonepropionase-like amidohydrolase